MQDRMQKAFLGEKEWLKIAKARKEREEIEDYKKSHDGRPPPESLFTRVRKMLFGRTRKENLKFYAEGMDGTSSNKETEEEFKQKSFKSFKQRRKSVTLLASEAKSGDEGKTW